jgi:hypothetical protein
MANSVKFHCNIWIAQIPSGVLAESCISASVLQNPIRLAVKWD